MRYVRGLVCVLALAAMGCSETTGTGGSGGAGGGGGWDDWFWDEDECPDCQCQGDYETFTTSLECFRCAYHCEPGLGPSCNGLIDEQTIIEYDCDRRYIREFTQNPEISFVIDTTTDEVVAASYGDDCCICRNRAPDAPIGDHRPRWGGRYRAACVPDALDLDAGPDPPPGSKGPHTTRRRSSPTSPTFVQIRDTV